ncbi:MAG: hypothetical protein K2N61_11825 [Lachnospiraceae bacterium]|nr:hypothetical protein [Lachnospiraceae bacterium]
MHFTGAAHKLHFENGKGCHKDRTLSKLLLKDNLDILLSRVKTVMPEITMLFICASAAGGTGSGMLPAAAKIISEKIRVNVCLVTVLPSKSENFQSYANTVQVFQEIEKLDNIGAVFILDNDRHGDKMKINEIFFTHLHALLANENGSSYGCLDRGEIDQLLETPGMAVMTKLGKDKAEQLLSSLTENNIYARTEADKVVKYIGLVSCGQKAPIEELISKIGIPVDTYSGTEAPANVCILTGMSLPKSRLNEIRAVAQKNVEVIRKNMEEAEESLFGEDVSFSDVFRDRKKDRRTERRAVSSLEIMNEFLN